MIVEGTLEDPEPVVPEHCEKGKIEEADTWSCNTETLDCNPAECADLAGESGNPSFV